MYRIPWWFGWAAQLIRLSLLGSKGLHRIPWCFGWAAQTSEHFQLDWITSFFDQATKTSSNEDLGKNGSPEKQVQHGHDFVEHGGQCLANRVYSLALVAEVLGKQEALQGRT